MQSAAVDSARVAVRLLGLSPLLLCWLVLAPALAYAGGDAHDALQRAALLVQQGRLEQADQQARLALATADTQAAACSVLGTIRLLQNRLPESVTFLEKAVRLEPRLLGAHLTLAQVYTLQGKSTLATRMYRRALEIDASNVAARLALAQHETTRDRHRESLALAQPVLAAFKQSPDGLVLLATNLMATGDRAAAAELAHAWSRLADVPPALSIRFALLLAEAGAVSQSITILERASRHAGPSYELAFNLAGLHRLNDDPARALEAYDLALTVRAEGAALREAAPLAEARGELERALSYWMRAKKLEPDDPAVLLGFGRVCLKMDLLDDAEPALTRAASARPNEVSYQYALAAAKVGKRQFEAAQSLLEPLVRTRPDDAQLQYALGSVLYMQGRLPEAAERLDESLKLRPDHLAAQYYRALIARDQSEDAEAVERLTALLVRHPEHAASREALGGLLMSAQRYSEAEEHLRHAVRLNPSSVKANYQLGLLLARMGRKDESARQLELAKTLREENEANSRLQLRLLESQP